MMMRPFIGSVSAWNSNLLSVKLKIIEMGKIIAEILQIQVLKQ